MSEITTTTPVTREAGTGARTATIGSWHWYTDEDGDKHLVCVVGVGSNYTKVQHPFGREWRVHDTEAEARLVPEPDAPLLIQHEITRCQQTTQRLMGEVQDLTAKLSLTHIGGGDSEALVHASTTPDIGAYKRALTKAKEHTLPKLFEQIKASNEELGQWLAAPTLPLQGQAKALRPLLAKIETRIFNVQLYAGLTEEVTIITEGAPAPATARVHLLQRRAYMDEECLVDYQHGGLEFKTMRAFDRWMVQPAHRDRLLPFPRCILAMQVRRHDKPRDFPNLSAYVAFILSDEKKWDQSTFLYIRNGEQLYRLSTDLDFGPQLFPDVEHLDLNQPLYGKRFVDFKEIVTERHYLDLQRLAQAYEAARRTHERNVARREAAGASTEDLHAPDYDHEARSFSEHDYVKWTPDTVYYDDIAAFLQRQIDQHNRVVMVLQGLFDRSPVFVPHPPVKLWDVEGFTDAITLVYDDSRALTVGAPPDFEAYRTRLNAQLRKGDVCVGQEDYWMRHEAEKENERRSRSWRRRESDYQLTRHTPYGNPGPGELATAEAVSPQGVTFRWARKRTGYYDSWTRKTKSDTIPCTLRVPTAEVFNVSAYTPGDYKPFFADPRTRADYLQWAPLLLEAEEYHAGNRTVGSSVKG